MATTTYILTKASDSAGECHIILRTYVRHDYRMRIQSRIWVSPKRWGKKNGITIEALIKPYDEYPIRARPIDKNFLASNPLAKETVDPVALQPTLGF